MALSSFDNTSMTRIRPLETRYHLIPVRDTRRHLADMNCQCDPQQPDASRPVWYHKAELGSAPAEGMIGVPLDQNGIPLEAPEGWLCVEQYKEIDVELRVPNIVDYCWTERGGRGFLSLTAFTGDPENFGVVELFLDQKQVNQLAVELGQAADTGLGEETLDRQAQDISRRDLMETEIVLVFKTSRFYVGRPYECIQIECEDEVVILRHKPRLEAYVVCESAEAAEQVCEDLRANRLQDVAVGGPIVKLILRAIGMILADGLSEEEIREMDEHYERTGADTWVPPGVQPVTAEP